MPFQSFSHVMMYVTDIERAVAFYKGTLGFSENYVALPHYASLRHGASGTRVDLHPTTNSDHVGRGPIPYFGVADLDATLAKLRGDGVKATDPKSEGGSPRFASFFDSEGNELGLTEIV